MPVSVTAKCEDRLRRRRRAPLWTVDDDLAALGELDRVADQVDQDLAQPARIADERVGHVGAMWQASSSPFSSARSGERLDRVRRRRRGGRTAMRLELELARLDLREVEDVVDDRRAARRPTSLTVLEVLALLGVERRCRSARSVMPMMPFIGVRISWLMLARNSLLAIVAASARCLATSSSLTSCFRFSVDSFSASSARLRSVTSRAAA